MDDDSFHRIKGGVNRDWVLLKQGIPTSLSRAVFCLQNFFNYMLIGKLNHNEMLAGIGLGNVFVNMLGYSIVFGLNGSLDTLVAQANG